MRRIKYKPLFEQTVLLEYKGKKKKVHLSIDYNINIKGIHDAVADTSAAASAIDADNYDATIVPLRTAVHKLFACTFGEETAKEICEFFHNDAIAMAAAFTPYITYEINPKLERGSYKRARKQQ